MLTILCLFLFAAGASATQNEEGERIVGGHNATHGQFPFQAYIRIPIGDSEIEYQFCAATIVSNRFALTTANCAGGHNPISRVRLRLVVGTHRVGSGGTQYKLDMITLHPRFNSITGTNNIAVIRTVESIAFSNPVRAIALTTTDASTRPNLPAIISGWGMIGVRTTDSLHPTQYSQKLRMNL